MGLTKPGHGRHERLEPSPGMEGMKRICGAQSPSIGSLMKHLHVMATAQNACTGAATFLRLIRLIVNGLGGGVPETLVHPLDVFDSLLRQVDAERANVLLRRSQSHVSNSSFCLADRPYQASHACSTACTSSILRHYYLAPKHGCPARRIYFATSFPHLQLGHAGGADDAGGHVPLACAESRQGCKCVAASENTGVHNAEQRLPLHQASASSVGVMPCFCATFTYSATACLASDLV